MPRRTKSPRGINKKKQVKQKKDKIAFVIIIFVVLAVIAGGWYYLSRPKQPVKDAIGCFQDHPPPEIVAIVIDRTDPVTPVQAAQIKNELSQVKADLPRQSELRAYTVGSVARETLSPDFRACHPGDLEEIDCWTESCKRAERRWREFSEKFERYLEGVSPSGSESESPLIESIRSIGATTFSDPLFNSDPKTRKRLIIVSDMLQNSSLFSHYRVWLNCKTETVGAVEQCIETNPKRGESCTMFGGRRVKTCEKSIVTKLDYGYWKSRIGTRLRAKLQGVEIEILYVRREGSVQQGGQHAGFWKDYFEDNGATVERIKSID